MTKRKAIGKKLRFEVFKRDKFTCQYCGRKAPDVILNVDHINPVANGGDNDMMNLTTSCFECNNGKADRTLADDSAVVVAREQAEEQQERINQVRMLADWHKAMATDVTSDAFVDVLLTYCPDYDVTEDDLDEIRLVIRRYGLSEALESLSTAVTQGYDGPLDKLAAIAKTRKIEREDPWLAKCRKAVYNRTYAMYGNVRYKTSAIQILNGLEGKIDDPMQELRDVMREYDTTTTYQVYTALADRWGL